MARALTYRLRRLRRLRQRPWYVGGVLVLVGLLVVTWVGRWGSAQYASERAEAWRMEAAQDAAAYAAGELEEMQRRLLERAEALAADPAVAQALRDYEAEPGAQAELVEHVASLQLSRRRAVEVYTPTPRLVAWNGFSMPTGTAPNTVRFLEGAQTEIVQDAGGLRRALVAWYPVRSGAQAVGAVRVMELIRIEYPVRNQYLEDYRLTDRWRWATGQTVRLQGGAEPLVQDVQDVQEAGGGPEAPAVRRVVRGPGGAVLGRLVVPLPPAEAPAQEARAAFDDVLVLWAVLLFFWLMGGLWNWYRAAAQPEAERSAQRLLLRALGRFGVVAAAWWGLRYLLLALDVPARWHPPRGPLAPLFDPTHLASSFGAGLMRSTGDLLLTGVFALLFAVAFLDLAARFRTKGGDLLGLRERLRRRARYEAEAEADVGTPPGSADRRPALLRGAGLAAAFTLVVVGLTYLLAMMTRQAVLDSTLDFFARTGLLPEPLVLSVFCALLLLAVAVILLVAGAAWITGWLLMRHGPRSGRKLLGSVGAGAGGTLILLYLLTSLGAVVGWPVTAGMAAVGGAMAVFGLVRPGAGLELLTLQRLLPSVLVVTALFYPMLYGAMSTHRQERILDAAASFSEGRDPRLIFAINQVLEELKRAPSLRRSLAGEARSASVFDSLAARQLQGSLLSSIGAYRVQLALYDARGDLLAQYAVSGPAARRAVSPGEFDILRTMYRERPGAGIMVEQMTGARERERFQYVGMTAVRVASGAPADSVALEPAPGATAAAALEERAPPVGWLVVRAAPQTLLPEAGTPFPQVLLPSGPYADLYSTLAMAEFYDGVLVRSLGRDFGRYRLPETIRQALRAQSALWRRQAVRGEQYLTFYLRRPIRSERAMPLMAPPGRSTVVAVRVSAITTPDHLYYLLRLVVTGMGLALPLYVLGLLLRWQHGRLPARRVRFRNKLVSAFFVVGTLSVVAMGVVGVDLIEEEGQRATRSQLRRQLDQVEETLAAEAHSGEAPYRVIERIGLDSVAMRTGTDLNLYAGARLVASSRPQLVREQLIDERLPAPVYEALYFDGFHFVMAHRRIGRFPYLAGYKVVTDAEGAPRYVLSMPTLPEQERIAEEQARMVAYLFGALLLLVLIVMLTAALLAGALTRPLVRLRAGLQALGKGRYAQPLPVSSRDEIGELTETFNAMRAQLAESRRKLAQQEREMAWREMARQVAHEIKNPLTPMKLSVQHLQRAYQRLERLERPAAGPVDREEEVPEPRFGDLFQRITGTLIEQIETLAHIANDFSSFARLPTRVLEPLDLNEVAREAVSLMQEDADGAEITSRLHPQPLIVEADQEELRRIYINLIKNALQAIPEGCAGRIEVTTARGPGTPGSNGAPGWAQSTVRDNGSGIPEELHDKIFQPNFSTKNSGTGLGLAIARKGIEEMQGEIGFETEEGAGTTFRLRLPLAED